MPWLLVLIYIIPYPTLPYPTLPYPTLPYPRNITLLHNDFNFPLDIVGLLDALDGVGLKLRPDVPFDAQLLAKYFFRFVLL